MQMQKRATKQMMATRSEHDKGQAKMIEQLAKYEDVGIAFYAFEDTSMRVLTHPSVENLSQKVEEAHKN